MSGEQWPEKLEGMGGKRKRFLVQIVSEFYSHLSLKPCSHLLLFPWFQGHHSLFSSSTHLLPSVLATSDSPLFCSEFVFQSINYIMSLSVEKPLMTSTAARVPIVLNVQQYWLITQHSSTLHLKSLDSRFSELLFVIQKFHMFFIFPALCIVSGWSHSRQQFTLCWKLPNLFL